MTTRTPTEQWDVFISYAREDYIPAKDLRDALSEYVTPQGAAPRIYLDVSREDGTPLGANWQSFLEEALPRSRYVVALYSQKYFDKHVCQWELHEAYKLNTPGEGGRLIPLLIDPGAVKKVPFIVHQINWISIARPHWIDEVARAVGLRAAESRTALRFAASLTDVVAGHTLPPVTVSGSAPDGATPWPAGGTVTVSVQPEDVGLTGTLTAQVVRDRAVFTDLAVRSATPEVRLVATAPGCEPVTSAPFAVRTRVEQPSWRETDDRPALPGRGHPVFFPDGLGLIVRDGRRVNVYSEAYEPVGAAELRERPRLWAHGRRCVAVADWSGRVVLASPDGRTRTVDLPARQDARFNVLGALAFDADDVLYVGTWGGTVWRLALATVKPEQMLECQGGVQVLAESREKLLVGALDGGLTVHQGHWVREEHTLEPLLLAMTRVGDFALVVGERQIHRLDLTSGRLLQVPQPVGPITGVIPGTELTAVINAEGQGVCFDAELAVRAGFRGVPGARPVASGLGGRLLVLENPDGSHALVRDGRTTYVSEHPMTVSADGSRAAVSDGERLLIVPPGELGGTAPAEGGRV